MQGEVLTMVEQSVNFNQSVPFVCNATLRGEIPPSGFMLTPTECFVMPTSILSFVTQYDLTSFLKPGEAVPSDRDISSILIQRFSSWLLQLSNQAQNLSQPGQSLFPSQIPHSLSDPSLLTNSFSSTSKIAFDPCSQALGSLQKSVISQKDTQVSQSFLQVGTSSVSAPSVENQPKTDPMLTVNSKVNTDSKHEKSCSSFVQADSIQSVDPTISAILNVWGDYVQLKALNHWMQSSSHESSDVVDAESIDLTWKPLFERSMAVLHKSLELSHSMVKDAGVSTKSL